MECSPVYEDIVGSGPTCLPRNLVQKIAEKVNISPAQPSEKIIEKAKEISGCTAESCAAIKILGEEKVEKFYNPKGPFNNNNWLSNVNIDNCLKLYAIKYKEFLHLPFQMIDFAKYNTELTNIDWKTVVNAYKCLGVVLNTDITGNPGQHWFALFIDWRSDPVSFEYFNSSGRSPPDEIMEFAAKSMTALQQYLGKTPIFEAVAKVRHQTKNSECGMYSLFYIISRIKKIPYSKFMYNKIDDSQVEKLRPIYFRHS